MQKMIEMADKSGNNGVNQKDFINLMRDLGLISDKNKQNLRNQEEELTKQMQNENPD